MIVLFEVERFNDPDIDAKLLDALFAIKSELLNKLQPLITEIDEVQGEMIIVLKPKESGFRAIYMDITLINKIEKITDTIKFADIIQSIVYSNRN